MMRTRQVIFAALFAALTAVSAFLRIPLGPVSVTPQFLLTVMAGVLLGAKWGAVSQLIYVVLGLLGLPLFTMGGGVGYVLQPTFGFLLGLIAAAAIVGHLAAPSPTPRRIVLASLAGLGALYAVGLPYMALIMNGYLHQSVPMGRLLMLGCVMFLPFDAIKIALAALLCPALLRRLSQHQ